MAGADLRIQYNEKMVGNGSPSLADTLNRFVNAYHLQDGINVIPYGESIAGAFISIAGAQGIWRDLTSTDLILPLAGIYKVTAYTTSEFIKSNIGSKITIKGRIYNVTQTSAIINSEFISVYCNNSTTNYDAFKSTGSITSFVTTIADAEVVRIQVMKLIEVGGILGDPNITSDTNGATKLIYERIG